jgi:hypothetical protein
LYFLFTMGDEARRAIIRNHWRGQSRHGVSSSQISLERRNALPVLSCAP